MALMLLQVLVLGVIAAAADDVPVTWLTSRALLPCVVPDAGRVQPRRPPPLLDDTHRPNPYSWRRDDVEYNPNRVLSNGSLDVRRREGPDGTLQCAVRTQAGIVLGYPIRLRSAYLEKFTVHPENTTAWIGQPVALSCDIGSAPPAIISWLRDGERLPKDDRYYLLKNQLLITDVRQSDVGLYKCIATNTHLNKNHTSHGGRLKVQASEYLEPSFLATFEERELMVPHTKDMMLPCPVQGWPRPELKWEMVTRDGHTVELSDADQTLVRSHMEFGQSGVYTCRVNGRADLMKTFNVTVTQPANITLPPASKDALRASTVRLSCSADGIPAPNVTWYKDGAPLALTGRIGLRKSYEEDRIELVISSVTSNDAGVYQCFASNNVSVSSAWAALAVTGHGAAPPDRVSCEPVGARDVAVRWMPVPERVVAYTVHTTPQGKPGMTLPGQPHTNTQEIVTVPEPLTPYRFQVRAYIQSAKNVATDFSEAVVCQGQGIPIQLLSLDPNTVLVSWRQFAEQTPGVLEWVLQWKEPEGLEHNVTMGSDITNYTLPLPKNTSLHVRVLGSKSRPWLAQDLSRVPWHPADQTTGDASAMPRDLEVTQVGPRGFTVRWKIDDLVPRTFGVLVCVTKVDGTEECTPSDTNSATIQNLQPESEYEVRVQMRIPGRDPVEAVLPDHVTTLSDEPDRFNLIYNFVNETTLRVSWRGAPGRYTVRHSAQADRPKKDWATLTTMGNTVLLNGINPGAETYVLVTGSDTGTQSRMLKVPPQLKDIEAKNLSYAFTSSGVTVSWVGAGPRVVRFAQNITQPLEAWHVVNATETHVQLVGLDPALRTFVTVTAPGSGRPSQVLTVPARPAGVSAVSIGVGVSCLVCVLLLIIVAGVCIWRKRKMQQSPVRSRRRNTSPTEGREGESSEMKNVGGRLANGGAAGEPLLNGHVHITENPTSKTPNGKMRKARYEAFDLSRHDADTTAETVLADASYALDTSRRPDTDTPHSLSTHNSFGKLPDDNMNSEVTRSVGLSPPTLQPNG